MYNPPSRSFTLSCFLVAFILEFTGQNLASKGVAILIFVFSFIFALILALHTGHHVIVLHRVRKKQGVGQNFFYSLKYLPPLIAYFLGGLVSKLVSIILLVS